jgi:hypothetical protein
MSAIDPTMDIPTRVNRLEWQMQAQDARGRANEERSLATDKTAAIAATVAEETRTDVRELKAMVSRMMFVNIMLIITVAAATIGAALTLVLGVLPTGP